MPQLLSEFVQEMNPGHPEPRLVPIDWREEFDGPYHSPAALRDEPKEPELFQWLTCPRISSRHDCENIRSSC
jgi:hypothetical protein